MLFTAILAVVFILAQAVKSQTEPRHRESNHGGYLRTDRRTRTRPSRDLNIRFSKIKFLNDTLGEQMLPLHAQDYPIQGHLADVVNTQTMAVSCIQPNDVQVLGFDAEEIIGAIGGRPSFPIQNRGAPFWYELREVVHWQELRRSNAAPATILTLPNIWSSFSDLAAVAEAVHSDFPGAWNVQLLQSFIKQGVAVDYDILPFRSLSDFVGLQVRMSALNTWAIDAISPINFLVKWTVGRPRPEEVAFDIYSNNLTAASGVPKDIIATIKSWNMTAATDFTAYPEGCPMHPSWPAMHSAAAASSFWMSAVFDLTNEQECQAKRLDFAEAFGRTVVGVHYRSDNIAGLRLGQEVIARLLPDHLARTYGSNATAVAEKIARLRFDWDSFEPSSCSLN